MIIVYWPSYCVRFEYFIIWCLYVNSNLQKKENKNIRKCFQKSKEKCKFIDGFFFKVFVAIGKILCVCVLNKLNSSYHHQSICRKISLTISIQREIIHLFSHHLFPKRDLFFLFFVKKFFLTFFLSIFPGLVDQAKVV